MIPILSVVGKSDSGKTTLLEKLIPELTRRGWRVATVKHDSHGFEVDHPGKDSYRHKQAGAHTAVIASPWRLAMIRDVERDLTLDEIRDRFVQDVDLVLSEGYKNDRQPKIEVFRPEQHDEPICKRSDGLVALVSDADIDLDVPRFGLDDAAGLAGFIETRFLEQPRPGHVSVRVDGRAVPMKSFVRDFIAGAVRGMLGALKDCDPKGTIDVHVEREKEEEIADRR